MPQIIINIPGDLSQAAADRFAATLPAGVTPKTAILLLMKARVRAKEKEAGEISATSDYTRTILALRAAGETDPDVGGSDLP